MHFTRFTSICSLIFFLAAPAHAEMKKYPTVVLQALDKVTARSSTFDVKVGETVQFGKLFIQPRTCQEPSALENPESASFLQIWESVTGEEETRWVFSGWMFASSPGLSSMSHPIYDVWVIDCKNPSTKTSSNMTPPDFPEEEAASEGTE